jgi:hypothetical protein
MVAFIIYTTLAIICYKNNFEDTIKEIWCGIKYFKVSQGWWQQSTRFGVMMHY